jgi:hypothetical protein
MNLNNITIEAHFNGNKIKLRELDQGKDNKDLIRIVRKFSENSTLMLYKKYRRGILSEEGMREYHLLNVLSSFKKIDKQLLPGMEVQSEMFEDCGDNELFCSYGSFKAPFSASTRKYIEKANFEMHNPNRELFHFAIEHENKLLGCFVFSSKKKFIGNCETNGSIDIFVRNKSSCHWLALMPLMFFIHNILGYREKSDDLYFRETTHPLNVDTIPIISPEQGSARTSTGLLSDERGFIYVDTFFDNSFKESRNRYIIKYSRLLVEAIKYFKPHEIVFSNQEEKCQFIWDEQENDWVEKIH